MRISPPRGLLAAFACLLVSLPVATANHSQAEQGKVIVFDHRGGNEWWVEVALGGQSASSVTKVEAMDFRGPWVNLEKKSWGTWAASFRIEASHPVKFRASWSDGAMVESCWFTHPAGVESCATPFGWQTVKAGDLGGSHGGDDIAVGDADNDGRQDVYVTSNEGIQVFRWTAQGWSRSVVPQSAGSGSVAVGDATNDGKNELWAGTTAGLRMFEWTGSSWVVRHTVQTSWGPITVGDVDDDGRREVYVAGYDGNGTILVVKVKDGTATASMLADLGMFQYPSAIWIGDGDADGDRELAVVTEFKGVGEILLVDGSPGAATVTQVAGVSAGQSIAVGDGDRDGKAEIFTAGTIYDPDGTQHSGILMSKRTAAGWQTTLIAAFPYVNDITFGDADGDGRSEVYVAWADIRQPAQLHMVGWTGSAWERRFLASVAPGAAGGLALGDADGDGKREAYMMAFRDWDSCCNNVDLYWIADHQQPAPSDPPRSGFDATFTGVRGNAWWVQAAVTATGDRLARVDVSFNGGAWQPLDDKGWGWARSYAISQGTVVQFRATSATNLVDLSDCYQWIPPSGQDAAKVSCSPPPGNSLTFDHKGGNEWWVEVRVTAQGVPPHEVHARDDGGAWVALTLRDWGNWAGSFRIEPGHKVQFRAVAHGSMSSVYDVQSCMFTHPGGMTPTGGQTCTVAT